MWIYRFTALKSDQVYFKSIYENWIYVFTDCKTFFTTFSFTLHPITNVSSPGGTRFKYVIQNDLIHFDNIFKV